MLASAILDGTPIDWDAADLTSDATDRDVVRRLRIVAEIAALHRQPDSLAPGEVAHPPVSDAPPALGTWGHLRLLEPIARGSFGEVYRAWDTRLDREVALKLLRTTSAGDDPTRSLSDPTRVVNEGRLLARVRHPHVITVYGAETRDGTVGIWMEFIRGLTLHQIVEKQGPLGAREAAGVGADLCRALSAVHGAGLLHRDVTARNVMREDGGRLVLMDFGAGHEWTDVSRGSGTDVTGTPLYLAPELFGERRADARTDIYALGTLLFYLVTRTFPVAGRSLAELRAAHAAGNRTRLRDLRADLPAAFVRAVETAIAVDPAERYQTAGAFEAALERTVVESSEPGRVRSRLAMAALVAAFGALVGAGIWAFSRSGDPARTDKGSSAAAMELTARRVTVPDKVFVFSNPSDDGRYVAGRTTDDGDVVIVDLSTGEYRPLHMNRGDASDGYASLGTLSPDARYVAVDWYSEDDGSLRVVGTDAAGARLLVDPPGDVRAYQWSRDGSLILAGLGLDGGNVLALVAVSDGGVRAIGRFGMRFPEHAALSPDGRYVVFDDLERAGSSDRDLYMVDAHTGDQWPLETSPGHDAAPFWTPDGRAVLFVSDRNRNPSLWTIPVSSGRRAGAARLIKDNIGRVWLRGLAQDGALHYQLSAGFAEVYVASLDEAVPRPRPLSPRQALSNFYPSWSPEGRYVAYASERRSRNWELWVYDVQSGSESQVRVPFPIGPPYGWSADSRFILITPENDVELVYTVDRETGQTELVATGLKRRPSWGPAGIVYDAGARTVVHDPSLRRTVRIFDFSDPAIAAVGRPPSIDGRSLLTRYKDGQMALHDTSTGRARTWEDPGAMEVREHVPAAHTAGVAYVVGRRDLQGQAWSLMVWGGSGEARELLRVHEPVDQFRLAGWTADGLSLLVIRWSFDAAKSRRVGDETLWRIPISGAAPEPTGLALHGLRDISLHPDGRQLVFNAGYKRGEEWVMENVLPR
jgi:serine/threonine-protein kinase